jgi:prefoldin subunit 5
MTDVISRTQRSLNKLKKIIDTEGLSEDILELYQQLEEINLRISELSRSKRSINFSKINLEDAEVMVNVIVPALLAARVIKK